MLEFEDLFNAVSGTDFEEKPVDIETFVTSPDYLDMGETPLSDYQYELIRASSQIYKEETLASLYGEEEGRKKYKVETKNEIIAALGKGCHAPYTPIFNPETGKWMRLDEATSDGKALSDDGKVHYATESFVEGFGRMVRVKTALGFEEDVYIGHKYLAFTKSKFYHRKDRNNSPEYLRMDSLNVGDRIAIALNFEVESPEDIPVEHAELIGYWIGDGCMPADHNQMLNMDFCSDEHESIARYRELCEFIGDSPTETVHPTKNMTIFRHGKNSNAVSLARKYGLWNARAKTKRIPDEVWKSSNDVIAAVVSRLWQADGCVYSKNGHTAEFVTVSPTLGNDMQKMLLRLGVPASIRSRTPKSNFENAAEAFYVTVGSQESFNAFISKVDLLDHKKVGRMDKSGRVYSRIDGDRYYDRIVSIEDIGDAEFWTRTVPDTGNYVGNGMISAQSGKDFISTIACAYIVYLLLCLKDPARYYGKPPGDNIDIINIAVNAAQANNIFFKNFKRRIDGAPWFRGKYSAKSGEIHFDKNINAYSGHSEREAFEGLNALFVVLDEISAFAMTNNSGNESAKTAQATYDMWRASVTSRFPSEGKIILLSFPRHANDFIMTRYNQVVADKDVVVRSHTFKLDPDLPDGKEENEFSIEWDEDHINAYNFPRVWALKRPSWEVNPTRELQDYMRDFYESPNVALARFAAMPPEAEGGLFRDPNKIDEALSSVNMIIPTNGVWVEGFSPDPNKVYYIHADLAQKVDRAAVSVAHVDRWTSREIAGKITTPSPEVVVDLIRYWTPTRDQMIDLTEVRDFVISLTGKGFNIGLVTVDRWAGGVDFLNDLKSRGIRTDVLSVGNEEYMHLAGAIGENRIRGPKDSILRSELLQLKFMPNGKIDHPRSGGKDLSDSFAGAVYNAVTHTKRNAHQEIEIRTLSDFSRADDAEPPKDGVIRNPDAGSIRPEMEDFLSGLRLL